MEDTARTPNRGIILQSPQRSVESFSSYRNSESPAPQRISGGIGYQNETRQPSEESAAVIVDSERQIKLESELEIDVSDEEPEYPREYSHVRSPELRRSEYVILMTAAAVCGAAGGVILALSDKPDPEVLLKLGEAAQSGFGKIFLQRTLLGAAFLLVEYLLAFFALGDNLVWTAPLCCALGVSFRITALQSWILLPSAIVCMIAVIAGASLSAGFSRSLMRLSRGGTVYLESSPRQKLTVSFLGCLAAVVAAAIYEGAIL